MINSMIYTQATKSKVINPSQWKDNAYISLTWLKDDPGKFVCRGCDRADVPFSPRGYCGDCEAVYSEVDRNTMQRAYQEEYPEEPCEACGSFDCDCRKHHDEFKCERCNWETFFDPCPICRGCENCCTCIAYGPDA